MTTENDFLLTRLAVRIDNPEDGAPIGSGIIYYSAHLGETVYILTAAHCLYKDKDKFEEPRTCVIVNFFSPSLESYQTIKIDVDHNLVSASADNDVAVLLISGAEVWKITGELPVINVIKERNSITSFVLKGFPSATFGKEIVLTRPVFEQELPGHKQFQLLLKDDFTTATSAESKVDGFSGSGVFLESNNKLYLYGLFTRFRDAQKIIYCQYIEAINALLEANFLPTLSYTYIGEYGLTPDFFSKYNRAALNNLGPRYDEKLNLRLPIIHAFHDIAKDDVFKRRLLQGVDKWLLHRSYSEHNKELLASIKSEFNTLKDWVRQWLSGIRWAMDELIDIEELGNRFSQIGKQIDTRQGELYELQRQEIDKEKQTNPKKANYGYIQPYSNDLYWLRDMERANAAFLESLNEISFTLANSPFLIIQGEAGTGKSHLLGDIANEAAQNETATLLFLGQLFNPAQTIWQNILNQLGLSCSKEALLNALNSIGRQQGKRLLILIDAINEGPGKDLWYNVLAGFIEEIRHYPFIGLVMTVRSTYFNALIPESLQKDPKITFREHEGFLGNEYVALKLFCEHYGLETPNFPILAPEFTNPLFLQLICQGLKASGENKFPQGFQGITKVYSYYIKAIRERLKAKREEYNFRDTLVEEAIYTIAEASFLNRESRVLKLSEAVDLFDEKFARHPNLLADLIHENVFIQSTKKDYRSETDYEVLYFSYERFGDFYIADQLLGKHKNVRDIKNAFKEGAELGKLLEDYYWRNKGILEALAVCLPEKYGIEIVEVYDWAFDEKHKSSHGDIDEWLSSYLWDSLKWRSPESIDNKKITKWLRSKKCRIREEGWFLGLVELATVHNHPFNSDRLFANLNRFNMADRDAFWQRHMRYYSGKDDNDHAFPIRRLIDWAWQKDISAKIDTETARLAAQTLAWMLSSTMRELRDQATKALVNLLEDQPDALLTVIGRFKEVDDMYILERLYAVAYGCALRTNKEKSLEKIAQFIFNNVFANGEPHVHVLLRDYARNVIEYALFRGLVINGDHSRIRPPYQSEWPATMPTEEDMMSYTSQFSDSDTQAEMVDKRTYNRIHFSVMEWDFSRYIIEPAISDFSPKSFIVEKEYNEFKKKSNRNIKTFLSAIESNYETQNLLTKHKNRGQQQLGGMLIQKLMDDTLGSFNTIIAALEEQLSEEAIELLRQKFLPYIEAKQSNSIPSLPIKRWIVKRAFDWYDAAKHSSHDDSLEHYNRHDYTIERIGKKYQWIALHEIVARLADNFYYSDGRYSKLVTYQGPWQDYLRDIDPVFITQNTEHETEENIKTVRPRMRPGWWFDSTYDYWKQPIELWVNNTKDLPSPQKIILRKDTDDNEWVYLKTYCSWEEPKMTGQDRYNRRRREIVYMINGYLVPKADKSKIVTWLNKKNFFGRWMPENGSVNLSLFNRENYWSPIAIHESDKTPWSTIHGSRHKVIVATSEAVGEMSKDKSGAHKRYDMPCKTIFEKMALRYAPDDGDFLNSAGETVVKNIDGNGVLVRKKDLFEFLAENEYEIIWTLLGEKNSMDHSERSANVFRAINGVFYFDDNNLIGNLSITDRQ